MKKLISIPILICLMVVSGFAQGPQPPILRNYFSTNLNPSIGQQTSNTMRITATQAGASLIRGHGAVSNAYIPFLGGSAASMVDLPARGNDVWANQKMPVMVLTSRGDTSGSNNLQSCTQLNMQQSILSFRSNGVLAFMTNMGINVIYMAENGWLTNHRDSNGFLQWNTNRWPLATGLVLNATPTNPVTWYCRTNGMGFGVTLYADPLVPTNHNTEIDLNPVSSAPYWHYPNGVNPFIAGTEIQPLIDGLHFHQDISTFYWWDIDMLTIQDTPDLIYYQAGYQNSLWNQLSYAILFPYYLTVPEDRFWPAGLYPQRRKINGIILNALISYPSSNCWPWAAEYQLNGMCLGSGGQSVEPAGSGVMGDTISNIRPEQSIMERWLPKTTHLIMQSDNVQGMDQWSHTDWKAHLSCVGMWASDLWLTYPEYRYAVNPVFSSQVTNAGFFSIWQDYARTRPYTISLGASNSIFARQLTQPNKVAVLFCNEAPTATNLTVYWTNLNSLNAQMGRAAFVTEVWTNTPLGIYSNNFTVAVQPTNVYWITIDFASSTNMIANSLTLSNGAGMVAEGPITYLKAAGGTNAITLYGYNAEVAINGTGDLGVPLTINRIGSSASMINFDFSVYIGRDPADGIFKFNGTQSGANGVSMGGANGTYATFLPSGIQLTNLTANFMSVPTNQAPATITTTDFTINTFYTNANQRAWVSACLNYSSGAIIGLWLDQDGDGTFEQIGIREHTSAVSTNQISAFVQPRGRFIFTNLAGTITVVPGSSQWVKQ